MDDRAARQQEVKEFRRQKILAAARNCIKDSGMAGTSMRSIAKSSGYSLGAAYTYFSSKEDIFTALLSSSFNKLLRLLRSELQQSGTRQQKITQAFNTFVQFFQTSKEDQLLLLTFFAGKRDGRQSLNEDIFRNLNNRFFTVLGLLANTVHENSKLTAEEAQSETLQAVSFLLGILMINSSGQLQIIGQPPQETVDRYLGQMLLRCNTLK